MDRLKQFEAMLEEVQRLHSESATRIETLKAQGKTRGTAIQQAIATKMTYQNMLVMYKRFGLLDEAE